MNNLKILPPDIPKPPRVPGRRRPPPNRLEHVVPSKASYMAYAEELLKTEPTNARSVANRNEVWRL